MREASDDDDDGLEIIEQPNCNPIDLKAFFKFSGNNVMQLKLNQVSVNQHIT